MECKYAEKCITKQDVDKLKQENAELREALEKIAAMDDVAKHGAAVTCADIATRAIQGKG
jgi:hypothetical protein